MLVHAYNLSTQAAEAGVGEFEPAWATQQECFKNFSKKQKYPQNGINMYITIIPINLIKNHSIKKYP